MEITTIEPFLDYYEKVRSRTKRVISLVPDESFDRSPVPGKFTFADLVRHLAAIERFMYAENVRGYPSRYEGCGKELADGREEVMRFFDTCHEESLQIFRRLTPAELRSKCTTPAGSPITVWKWLRLMIEHEIHHRGQIYTYLGLMGVETKPLYGLTSEQVAAQAAPSRKRNDSR
ncbi:MAG TPA: DinB family protein [Vicinamibacteria bacterium]|nr:DinB family protein [Vicinamibacteria bacterium]